MAKNKNPHDFDDGPPETAAPLTDYEKVALASAPSDPARAALEAEITALKTRLAKRDADVAELTGHLETMTAPATPHPKADFWEVRLPHGPTHVVEAKDPANAWEQFKKEMGVLGSEHQHECHPSSEENRRIAEDRRLKRAEHTPFKPVHLPV